MSTVAFEARNSGTQPLPAVQTVPMFRARKRDVQIPEVIRNFRRRGVPRDPVPNPLCQRRQRIRVLAKVTSVGSQGIS